MAKEKEPQDPLELLEKVTQERDALLTVFLEIEDGYVECDLAGFTQYFNPALCRIVGYPAREMKGMGYKTYLDKENAQQVFRVFNEVYLTGQPKKAFNYEITRKDGSKSVVEISITLRRNKEGEPDGYRCIMRDVTDRRKAEMELAKHKTRLEAIFRSVKDAIVTVDQDLKVIDANKAAATLCGIAAKNVKNNPFALCPTDCCQACRDVLAETLKRKTAIREFQVECNHKQRPQQKVSLSSAPLESQDGEFLGAVLVIRDITRLVDLERELQERNQFHNIIGASHKMQAVYQLLENLADFETTVLITGESGTGKELVAKALHHTGSRAFKPFVSVNCSALAENLLESELFGHVKGAFTGAIRDYQGRFQAAHTGTLLLDEIGDISPRIQLKLLRVLQEREFERVGDVQPIKVDVRVIACTNQDLKEKVRLGEFREDLYYRLNVMEIKLPPLRERREDIPLLADHFTARFEKKFNITIPGVSDKVMNAFMNYHWPGNVRELEHSIERATVLCRDKMISLEHIPGEIAEAYSLAGPRLKKQPAADEPNEIIDALKRTGWNKAKAARLLGVSRKTIYRKIEKYGIQSPAENM
ncbi:sigma-54-dependent Fis family transcriptional regulator [Desulfatibacillum aliphaticivorans]|uniref:sigma-54-dependent Fis family transcriptional regulator n=1 Tax=Desulfatibacillum aliphaticivorans TaxID=218208 RepID=UPI0004003466|nr:sigma-54-dependent Fis family transcriptional regulator [Desulfatibacillum aliphaticivorans]